MISRPTGIGRFVSALVDGIAPFLAADEHVILHAGVARLNPLFGHSHANLRAAETHARVTVRRQFVPLSLTYALWNRGERVPVETFIGEIDVYHGTNFLIPATRQARRIASIHDLAILVDPTSVPAPVARRFRTAVERAAAHADAIVTISQATADRIVDRLQVPPEKVHVIHLAVSPEFSPAADLERERAVCAGAPGLEALDDGRPFALFVGTTVRRKNVARLVQAFARARGQGALPHRLVIAGAPGFDEDAVAAAIAETTLGDHVLRVDYVTEDVLRALYRCAAGFAFPSLDEGFGLPLLEAFASDCPTLAARRGALPEVGGDAAIWVDPEDLDELSDGLVRLLTDEAERARLRRAGRIRVQAFDWARCAEAHLKLYRSVR